MKVKIIEAIEAAGYEIFDGRFIEKTQTGYLTVAYDDDSNIQIADGDYRQYYNNYKHVYLISENTDLDKIDFVE